MPLTEAEIINATNEYIERNQIVYAIKLGERDFEPLPILAVLLAYEEEIRRLHEAKP